MTETTNPYTAGAANMRRIAAEKRDAADLLMAEAAEIETAADRYEFPMKALAALLLLSACAAPPLQLGTVPRCPGCLPAYANIGPWSMSVYEVGTRRLVLTCAGVWQTQAECQDAGMSLGNPDVYAVCRPEGDAS